MFKEKLSFLLCAQIILAFFSLIALILSIKVPEFNVLLDFLLFASFLLISIPHKEEIKSKVIYIYYGATVLCLIRFLLDVMTYYG